MKAFIYAFQGRPWNEECAAAYRGFTELGIECVRFSTNDELDKRSPEDVVVGGMLIMGHVLRQSGIEPPDYNYPDELSEYLGRKIWTIRLKDLQYQKRPLFIKPAEEKAAKGIIVNSSDVPDEYKNMDPEDEILCSDAVDFVSEWRCFVYYNKILGIQFYYGDKGILPDRDIIESAIKDFKSAPAACSLDFGVTADGRTLLIEMNDGMALGCYGLRDDLYALFLSARWAELTGTIDVLRVRTGYVEEKINRIKDDYLAAYLMIDVDKKTGSESIPERLEELFQLTPEYKYMALCDYLDETVAREIMLTDDGISIENDSDAWWLLEAFRGRNINLHLRVAPDRVKQTERLLEKATEERIKDERWLFFFLEKRG